MLQDLLTALQLSTGVDIGSFDALQGASEGSPQVHSCVRVGQHHNFVTRVLHHVQTERRFLSRNSDSVKTVLIA